jgi:hypothetical protein
MLGLVCLALFSSVWRASFIQGNRKFVLVPAPEKHQGLTSTAILNMLLAVATEPLASLTSSLPRTSFDGAMDSSRNLRCPF